MSYRKPKFIVKKYLQKSKSTNVFFSDEVTPDIFGDVCRRITGITDFDFDYVDNSYRDEFLEPTYNKGRLALLFYQNYVYYISFSEKKVNGRNASVQSVPTAFNLFSSCTYRNKKLYYYFLDVNGNANTFYFKLFYKLMATIGFVFLNSSGTLSSVVSSFSNIDQLVAFRKSNSLRNSSNNSTYITKSGPFDFDIYGKTYGASKYETSMICYALSFLARNEDKITLYEVVENDLSELPKISREVISSLGKIRIVKTDLTLEKRNFDKDRGDNLRSESYIFNLLETLGDKHCALCDCSIPEIIQGAHIWPVSEIRKSSLKKDEKFKDAIDGSNGLWLCENHHKLFDDNIIKIDNSGNVVFNNQISNEEREYLEKITPVRKLSSKVFTSKFEEYLELRNKIFDYIAS